jgi:hypothetical protein
VDVLDALQEAGTLSKADFMAWLDAPLIKLGVRILFAARRRRSNWRKMRRKIE